MIGTSVSPRPTTLSARAARRLADGPLDAVTLMRDVCQVERLQVDAAERMALALLGSHPEFVRLPTGHWTLSAGALAEGVPPSMARPSQGRGAPAVVAEAPASQPRLLDLPFAVVDVETTGTRAAGGDRITEIAIVQVQGGRVGEVYSRLVNPGRPIPPYITALTHISWEMVRDQPSFREITGDVLERLRGSIFVAHNASFDWRFVSEEVRRGSGQELAGPRLCTVRFARAALPQLSRRSLDHVTRHFNIEIEARHRAAGDAIATAHALCRMLNIAADHGVESWTALQAFVDGPVGAKSRTASDRRRRAFPLPVTKDDIA
ncbi:MAG TPA: 3'-5' exonuclease [Gemmatimonas sp.]|uniref:3'-5' exonuclease n=1 Tax=Gemmatimonas sp. TaxID=1962908 RepID=UPI002ED7C8DD